MINLEMKTVIVLLDTLIMEYIVKDVILNVTIVINFMITVLIE